MKMLTGTWCFGHGIVPPVTCDEPGSTPGNQKMLLPNIMLLPQVPDNSQTLELKHLER